MKKYLLLTLFSLLLVCAFSQSLPMKVHGMLFFEGHYWPSGDTTGTSDCWGWTSPEGEDYAIIGTMYGTHYVRASDMKRCDSLKGPGNNDYYYHRDIKTYRNYAYIVSEMTGTHAGLEIVDLSYLPDSIHFVGSYIDSTWVTSHNMSIDTATATAYVLRGSAGARIISLANPEQPVDIGFIPVNSIHDVYARNDTAWIAEGYGGDYSIWDVSNKSNPVKVGYIADPNAGYAHNIWPTDDGKYFMTTEETPFKTVKIWNATNFSNITLEGQYLAPCSLAHNVQIKGDSAYLSHYESGVTVVDISNKSQPKEVAHFDTYPQADGNGFYGCWGVFQYTQSGYIYASSFEGRLHVLEMDTLVTGRAEPKPYNATLGTVSPNPFSDLLHIPVDLKASGLISLDILDLKGSLLANLTHQNYAPGTHEFSWNGKDNQGAILPAGVYLLRLTTEEAISMQKVVKGE
ncbi:MAG: choice-of-anchor B family protein [Bacteroidia bacterium]|nr:choice-of-anchor B family protein [Bacteroidia bacterium]